MRRGNDRDYKPLAWCSPSDELVSKWSRKRVIICSVLLAMFTVLPRQFAATEALKVACIGSLMSPFGRTSPAFAAAIPITISPCCVTWLSTCFVERRQPRSASRPNGSRRVGASSIFYKFLMGFIRCDCPASFSGYLKLLYGEDAPSASLPPFSELPINVSPALAPSSLAALETPLSLAWYRTHSDAFPPG